MSEYDNIGQFVKDKLEGHRETPSGELWNQLEGRIPSKPASSPVKNWWIASTGLITIAAILYFAVFNNGENNQSEQTTQKQLTEQIDTDKNKPEPAQENKAVVKETPAKPDPEPQKDQPKTVEKTEAAKQIQQKQKQVSEIPFIESRKLALDSQNPVKNEVPIDKPSPEPFYTSDNNFALTDEIKSHEIRKVKFSEDKKVCAGEKVALWASGGKRYFWSTGSTDSVISVLPHQNSEYSVTVVNDAEQEIIHDFNLVVQECAEVYVPNAFTPNADGSNDIFRAYGVAVESFRMHIYDRTGNIIFETENINEGWDGNHLDRPANEGVYLYRIVYTGVEGESKTLTGTLTLIR
ncbi:MAG: gliding motility-associated C-terminal domain-containing protein [Bacteroidota bacterium]